MIDFSLVTFGKSLSDLTYHDIVRFFINEHSESDNIEFKSFSSTYGDFNTNIKGIIKAICGLLNSNGGIVIWGAPIGVEDANTNEKKYQGNLAPVRDYKVKDWIINKVSGSITPLPVGIKVQVLQNNPAENLYIFEVQPSPYKPHQFENIYLIRLDGQTKPAPHYFIEALFRRVSYPNIEGYLRFDEVRFVQSPSRYIVNMTIGIFNFSKLQNEENVIYRLVTFPGRFMNSLSSQGSSTYEGKEGLLHFGAPMVNPQPIILTEEELDQNDFQVKIILMIGGKKSPAKTSDYTLNLKNIDLTHPYNTADLTVSRTENQLFSEKQEQLGKNKETTLFSFLGRVP